MSNHTKVVDGVVVTDTDILSLMDWTNVYDDIGGDMRWGEDIAEQIKERGLDGDVGDKDFLFWNALDDSMYLVKGGLDLQTIVGSIDDQGFNGLDLEEV
ncbi:uncharacterized protein NECHADRAFT_94688 [Fusarium vanettenii 77-13-4]|uniref:Uncharacterized protein n=1 Tax=Fusarium vanettenii (strain ATCC MYA-4622 / CBS 123669 / FGSC 9596 / NRRL 45880 / 77-13-4) TaxID=660122 RepID=C7ZAE6_FUSV7|nr:uncharacterized protein NECHADRAFT_94688 [Fusarium vanettenii 77-13-4]EEU39262.1 hypothetical protein NECHADRAFT_94688 [Fusarium vanettenii 77-13-4]